MIVFVSGGARSGKSGVAERLVRQYQAARGGERYYLATASAADEEMATRIARHRDERGEEWLTLESSVDIDATLATIPHGSSILLDCLTLWASRAMFESGLEAPEGRALLSRCLAVARQRGIILVVVSNDLNEDLPPRDPLVWGYLALLQSLHRDLVAEADRVIEVVAGQIIDWQGEEA
ncbi:bifunctional adenosylcobinamide kinase/adenosylcobinamide-phosphate guanylyltransferase [Halomonas halmophila]|nr:bifunctional adenosylcobinamide kinase/adenosylcobinamide-phosphate guanylyltransferase [Halomonas halmophila]